MKNLYSLHLNLNSLLIFILIVFTFKRRERRGRTITHAYYLLTVSPAKNIKTIYPVKMNNIQHNNKL